MTIKIYMYQLEILYYAQKPFTCVAEALTPLLRLGAFSWIVTRDSHQKISQFPTLVAAHQAEVRGPPADRGPQVENRCNREMKFVAYMLQSRRYTCITLHLYYCTFVFTYFTVVGHYRALATY